MNNFQQLNFGQGYDLGGISGKEIKSVLITVDKDYISEYSMYILEAYIPAATPSMRSDPRPTDLNWLCKVSISQNIAKVKGKKP